MTGAENNETPGSGGDQGSRPPQADVIQPDNGTQRVDVLPEDRHRRPRIGGRLRSSHVGSDPPDLGALAKEAVISFLHDASNATAEREAARAETDGAGASAVTTAGTGVINGPGEADGISAADEPLPGTAAADASRADAESVAWRAASVGLATLDRIEAAAASIEADIRAALQAQADLQAGAGAAAEAAVSAAAFEDNPDDVALTLRALKKNNILNHITVASDGAEALEFLFGSDADMSEPGLILLDLKLPKIDGLEVLRRIRADERTNLIPIVILTSSKLEEDILSSYRKGANAYVRKPVNFTEFADAIKTVGLFWLLLNEAVPE